MLLLEILFYYAIKNGTLGPGTAYILFTFLAQKWFCELSQEIYGSISQACCYIGKSTLSTTMRIKKPQICCFRRLNVLVLPFKKKCIVLGSLL